MCPDGVAASGYNLHYHLYMTKCKKCPPDPLDLDVHTFLALPIINVWLLPVSYSKFVNCPLILTQTYVRADL